MATYSSKAVRPGQDDVFFSGMPILILGTVFLGFTRGYYLPGVFHAHMPPDLLIHLHAAVSLRMDPLAGRPGVVHIRQAFGLA
jgi:hypothetical protein